MKPKLTISEFVSTRPIRTTLLLSTLFGSIYFLMVFFSIHTNRHILDILVSLLPSFFGSCWISLMLTGPVSITIYNIYYLFTRKVTPEKLKAGRWIEGATILFGAYCTFLWSQLREICWDSDWMVQLYNGQHHTPIATWTVPTLTTVAAIAFAGYLLLRLRSIHKLPPLLATLAIGAMYLGGALCVVWCIQLFPYDPVICIYPCNLLLIGSKVIKELIIDWNTETHPVPQGKSKLILSIHSLLSRAENWPWLGMLLALPLLGLTIAILTLFGQTPDSIIQAWTQTSDWTLSQQVAPQNIYVDQHYLCTVAAGGHPKVVKPLREGMRHGHKVLVNRQLCIANAFEQLLQERLPRTHRAVRSFYDKYGYPIAKHIKSPYTADVIWFLMKPLEWFFLTVLYLCDSKPENRIAVQYPHAPLPKQQ